MAKSEGRLANLPVALIRISPEPRQRVIDANRLAAELLGFEDVEALLQASPGDYPEGPPLLADLAEAFQASEPGAVVTRQAWLPRGDGSRIWVEFSAQAERDADGAIRWLDIAMADRTKQRQLQEDLSHRQAELSGILDSTDDCIVLVDSELTYVYGNEAATRFAGVERSEGIGLHMSEVLAHTPKFRDRWIERMRRVFAEQTSLRFEDREDRDGGMIHTESVAFPVRDDAGTVFAVTVVLRDVTARRAAEEALRESEQRYRALVDGAGEVIAVVDAEGVFRFMNSVAAGRLGSTPEALVGRSYWDLFPKPVADRHFEAVQRVIATGEGGTWDSREMIDGQERMYSTSLRPLRDAEGHTSSVLIIARDVTQRRQAEAELREAYDRLKLLEDIVERGRAVVFRWRVAADFPVEFVTKNVRQFGYSAEDFISGRVSWPGVTHPVDDRRLREEVGEHLARGDSEFRQQYRVFTPAGETVWIEDHNRVIRDERGAVTHIEGVLWNVTDRVIAERALRRERDRSQQYLDIAATVMVALDAHGCVTLLNRQGCEMLGISQNEALGKNWFDLVLPPESRQRNGERFQRIMDGRQPIGEYVEREVVTLGGQRRLIAWHSVLLRDEAGAITGTLSSGEDITERRQAELALRQSEEKYRTLSENVRDIVYSLDRDGTVTYISMQVKPYGFDPPAMVGTPFSQYLHPEDVERVLEDFRATMAGGRDMPTLFRVPLPGGGVRWFEERGRALRDADGTIVGQTGVLRDVTDRKQIEEAYHTLVDQSSQGLLIVQDDHVAFCNAAFARMLGCAVDEVVTFDVDRLFAMVHPDDIATVRQRYTGRVEGRTPPQEYEFRWISRDGRTVWSDVFVRPIMYRERPAFQIAFADVTERHHAEQQAGLYRKRLRRLATELSLAEQRERRRLSTVLHDEVSQLLSLVNIRLSLLRDAEDPTEAAEHVREVERLINRADHVTRSLTLQLSHPALYDMGLQRAAEWLVEDIRDLYGLAVALEDDGRAPRCSEAIRIVLYQCLRELLVNVAKHAGVDTARVVIGSSDGRISVTVTDDGKGFDPADAVTDSDGGYGLFSVRERIESLGGRFDIASAPGRGTRVSLEVDANIHRSDSDPHPRSASGDPT